MAKKKREEEQEEVTRLRLPDRENEEMLAIIDQKLGGPHLRVICEDGKERLARIPGRLQRRVWFRVGDVVIIKLWEYRKDRCDVIYKYTAAQVDRLRREGYLKPFEEYLGSF